MGEPSFFQIPGNIKQQQLPFVLNKSSKINKTAKNSTKLKGAKPQVFSFRNGAANSDTPAAKLQFYPSSLNSICINDDISYKLLHNIRNGSKVPSSITLNDILANVPAIQIREFLPDTRLNLCINMFTNMFENMTKLFTNDKSESTQASQQSGDALKQDTKEASSDAWYKKLWNCAWFTMKYMVGAYPNGNPSFMNDMGTLSGKKFDTYSSMNKSVKKYVLDFPYMLYYTLQSCTTTNLYEVPGITSDKLIMDAQGTKGWTSGGDLMSSGGLRLSGILGKIPVVGAIASTILNNIGINYMPWWDAESGSKTEQPEVEVKFDLFNDSAQAAMINFIFVNTIVPGNRWIQYNMFLHSSNVYDIKIEGINRLFACAGNFNVTYDGVLRNPSYKWVEDLVNTYGNTNVINTGELKTKLHNENLVKIPDVYHVSLKFTSLLPANFNNYIYTFANNNNIVTEYSDGKNTYQESQIGKSISDAMAKYSDRISKVWKSGEEAGKK